MYVDYILLVTLIGVRPGFRFKFTTHVKSDWTVNLKDMKNFGYGGGQQGVAKFGVAIIFWENGKKCFGVSKIFGGGKNLHYTRWLVLHTMWDDLFCTLCEMTCFPHTVRWFALQTTDDLFCALHKMTCSHATLYRMQKQVIKVIFHFPIFPWLL